MRGFRKLATPYSCLGNPMDRGAWWATIHGVAMSQTRLSDQTTTTTAHFISSLKILQARPVTLSWTRRRWDDLTKVQKPLTGRLWTRSQVCLTSNTQLLFSCTCLLPWWAEKGFLCSIHWTLSHETTAQWGSGTSSVWLGEKWTSLFEGCQNLLHQNQVSHHHHRHPERVPKEANSPNMNYSSAE